QHVLAWLIVFAIWYYLRYQDYHLPQTALLVTLVKVVDLALLIYITNYVLLPKLFYRKKYGLFVVSFVLLIILSSFLKMNILGRIMHAPNYYSLSGNLKTRIYDNVIPHFFLVIAGAAIQLMIDYTFLQRRMAETARERVQAELNFLKSQINPHFLFNSLNSVYFLIDKNNTAARESLHKFSDMLRYQLYEMNAAGSPIEKEVSYLHDYIYLQKLRKEEVYQITFNADEELKGFSIEPLLLIPLVENAFKHISHFTSAENFIRIDMALQDDQFIFTIENSCEQGRTLPMPAEAGGIGLNNVRRRLELVYPGKHQLEIHPGDSRFRVELMIKIKS
ncbi:MAG: GHKL domain-containing protein, partial [Pedobacter sp.]